MILPIVGYGTPVLRERAKQIDTYSPEIKQLITDMFDTMEGALGVGLAAPQIGKAIRLFVVDCRPFADEDQHTQAEFNFLSTFKKVFINAKILKEEGEEWSFNEGCLSVPGVRENILRKPNITIEYQDENFEKQILELSGLAARVVQHEYDHIEGILFTDKMSSLKKKINAKRLKNIIDGKVIIDYKMKFIGKKAR